MDIKKEIKTIQNLSDKELKSQIARKKSERELLSMKASFQRAGAGYTGADTTRRFSRNWNVPSGTPDELILGDRRVIQDMAEDLYRNNSIMRGIVDNKTENTVGTKFRLQSTIDREVLGLTQEQKEEWQKNTERKWRNHSESTDCDAERKHNFSEKIEIAMRAFQTVGEVFALYPRFKHKGSKNKTLVKLQLMPARRCQNPYVANDDRMRDGIEVNERGEPEFYWFLKKEGFYSATFASQDNYAKIPAYGPLTGRRNIIHTYRCDFIGQNRGMPFVASIIEDLKNIDRGGKNELTNMAVSGLFTAFITSDKDPFTDPFEGTSEAVPTRDQDYTLDAGATIRMDPGDSVEFANPGRPNSNVIDFIKQYLSLISMAVGVSYESLVRQYNSSFTASKAARLDSERHYKNELKRIVPTASNYYDEWLIDSIIIGDIEAPGFFLSEDIRKAWSNHGWNIDSMGLLDPVRETQAAIMKIREGLSTRTAEAAKMGSDFEKNIEIAKRENRLMGEAGLIYPADLEPPEKFEEKEEEEKKENENK